MSGVDTTAGQPIQSDAINRYFDRLVARFYKILPMREKDEVTLPVYVRGLQIELLGCKAFVDGLESDADMLSLLSTLQFLADEPTCSVGEVRRIVFGAINLCNKLRDRYAMAQGRCDH